jgi:hypothetical protein
MLGKPFARNIDTKFIIQVMKLIIKHYDKEINWFFFVNIYIIY